MIDCYRDPSILQFIATNLSDIYKDLNSFYLGRAFNKIFDSRNVISIASVMESQSWIREWIKYTGKKK